jgi:SAM-dependent methyltransferase
VYERSARLYDAVFAPRHDYPREAERLRGWIEARRRSAGNALLDVACGTGAYLPHLSRWYAVEGLDRSRAMLAIAGPRNPGVPFYQGDLVSFDLGRRFDVVLCLGSSIGYARTLPRLRRAIQAFADHTADGGVVVVEPWFDPEAWEAGRLTLDFVDEAALKVARVLVSGITGVTVSTLDIHHMVATPAGVETFAERHELGLFSRAEYEAAFRAARLAVAHHPDGLLGRGLYIGSKA